MIPTDGWNSLLNSGKIAHFKDNATKLSETYSEIQWYNNELKILRDAVEKEFIDFYDIRRESNFHDISRESKTPRSEILRMYTSEREKKLLEKLFDAKKLLNQMVIEKWWQFWR